ncbi:MAG: hypothetical protein IJI39_00085 [Clostridia bacterium]|nr:hypothetical protein [Clostridia bacterium]
MDLYNPVSTVPIDYEIFTKTASGKYVCSICGYVYDPAVDNPDIYNETTGHKMMMFHLEVWAAVITLMRGDGEKVDC